MNEATIRARLDEARRELDLMGVMALLTSSPTWGRSQGQSIRWTASTTMVITSPETAGGRPSLNS